MLKKKGGKKGDSNPFLSEWMEKNQVRLASHQTVNQRKGTTAKKTGRILT